MKLKAIKPVKLCDTFALIEGVEYDIVRYSGTPLYLLALQGHDYNVSLEWFEAPKDRFIRLLQKCAKAVIPNKRPGVTVDLLVTDRFYSIYHHSKGNQWNISGQHYWYNHDVETGEFLHGAGIARESVIHKTRLYKADLEKMLATYKNKR